MPYDAMVVSAAVIAVFVGFAVVLVWADFETRSAGLKAGSAAGKRRSY